MCYFAREIKEIIAVQIIHVNFSLLISSPEQTKGEVRGENIIGANQKDFSEILSQ